ncbi:NUDIX hydrolase [Corynebacterium renale]|uniref:NUDIX hydrolase n=1 Tax=Corynebacterium renale TaxID=1724 RepID=UPI001E4B0854|nr:NUDIX hydrolase [Corynebacterium renale]
MQMRETTKDAAASIVMTGRYQKVPRNPGAAYTRPILAAGAVMWRHHNGRAEVALIHRPRYNDWSLPKGKVDKGENLPATAVREILEETGYPVRLGKLLGHVTYPVKNNTKVVYYWTAKVTGEQVATDDEADELRWLPVDEAQELLSYELDHMILAQAQRRFDNPTDTRMILVRHGRAGERSEWEGPDDARPLDPKGRDQAQGLVSVLEAYQPTALYTAAPDRCVQTVLPASKALGLRLTIDPLLGDDAFTSSPAATEERYRQLIAAGGTPVVCAQGAVIPGILEALAAEADFTLPHTHTKKGAAWVLSFRDGVLSGADYLRSALPVK